MIRKPLQQSEFISALDFVKTDIDNLRAYFEQGAVSPSPAILEKALGMRSSIEMFVSLFGMPENNQSKRIADNKKQSGGTLQASILNEVLNVKELLIKQGMGYISAPNSEIATLKEQIATSLAGLEQRIINNIEYSQKTQIQEFSQKVISELTFQPRSYQTSMTVELLSEIEQFREETAKQISSCERNILYGIEASKEEIIHAGKSTEILKELQEEKASTQQALVLAKTSMQVLRGISKQLIGMYQSEKKSLAQIEKAISGGNFANPMATQEELELSEGFAQLKEELHSLSSIINFEELEKIKDTNQAIQLVDSYANSQFEPQGLVETAKELEALATELFELEKAQQEHAFDFIEYTQDESEESSEAVEESAEEVEETLLAEEPQQESDEIEETQEVMDNFAKPEEEVDGYVQTKLYEFMTEELEILQEETTKTKAEESSDIQEDENSAKLSEDETDLEDTSQVEEEISQEEENNQE